MRIAGWEGRLAEVIEGARSRPYALGEHDCFRLACEVVRALTGRELWLHFAGTYRTRREALRKIAELGNSPEEAAASLFGEPIPIGLAGRGDLVLVRADGDHHLGVVLGEEIAMLGEQGVVSFRRDDARLVCAFGV